MNIGDRVCLRSDGSAGTVGDMAGNIVYVDMDNGVEHEVKVSDLILESDNETPREKAEREKNMERDAQNAVAQIVLDELGDDFVNIGHSAQIHASAAIVSIGGSAAPWDNLEPLQKLNFVSVATGVPTAMWLDAYTTGNITKLKLTAYAMIAQAMKEGV